MARAAAQNSEITAPETKLVGKPFEKGKSGNPGGRPKGLARKIRDEYGEDGGTLLTVLGVIAHDSRAANSDRIAATKILLERGWGKPPAFAPIEEGDPLELADAEAEEIAAAFDRRVDELAARRERGKPPAPAKTRRKAS